VPILKNYDKDFFKTWSSDMAYILGFMYADGNITASKRGTHFVAIYTADKDIVIKMKRCFKSEHKISEIKSSAGVVYRIQIGSKEWFCDLGKIGLSPDKTKRMVLPCIPQKYIGSYIRGFFDGDGNVWSGLIHKNRPNPTITLQVGFTSASTNFLEDLKLLLQTNGIAGGGIYSPKMHNYSRLLFSSNDALKIYNIMYNAEHKLFLKRKKVVFDKFIQNCGRSSTG
jgi:LAGLIDADG-like domain